ncbi:related to aflatoxin efflux pump AFLT [Serendipita indica DSM 11827]|uniref:Related to aflatoxin efflux pump AFLT n=1 Tax=Serendipita indica (strain DSM 11827) TaxID=1109443 RepID=G4TW92_SERID|nr:related to aflatoxin efflux pump AFLT [Serendipita indica DSM 11827]
MERPRRDCSFGVLLALLVLWERRLGDRAMMPISILFRRTQVSAGIANFSIMFIGIFYTYYLPFFYQAKGRTAEQSGIDILPLMMGTVLGSGLAGYLNSATGRYTPYLIAGPILYAIAAGLFFTVDEFTSNAKLIGFQILFGVGEGLAFQQPLVAIQAEYADTPALIPQASSMLTYLQLLGAVVGISIAGAVFGNQLSKNLAAYQALFGQEVIDGLKQSVTVIFMLPKLLQGIVIHAYVDALRYVFIIAVPLAGVTIISAFFIKNYNLKERGVKPGAAVA